MEKVSPLLDLWVRVAAFCALALLPACSSPFSLTVVAPKPDDIAAVFVIYGKDADFVVQGDSAAVATLVHPDKLADYYGHAQFEVTGVGEDATWQLLDESLETLGVKPNMPDHTLRLGLPEAQLDARKDLAIAVVARSGRTYHFQRWRHADLETSKGKLAVTVTRDGVVGSF